MDVVTFFSATLSVLAAKNRSFFLSKGHVWATATIFYSTSRRAGGQQGTRSPSAVLCGGGGAPQFNPLARALFCQGTEGPVGGKGICSLSPGASGHLITYLFIHSTSGFCYFPFPWEEKTEIIQMISSPRVGVGQSWPNPAFVPRKLCEHGKGTLLLWS